MTKIQNYCAFIVLCVCFNSPTLFANSQFPSCSQISLDEDGDGFGYENDQTCIVDANTSLTPVAGECIDDNADGWGWNGVGSCQVPVINNTECQDTEPRGDGWGWNGSSSCRVVPALVPIFSELEDLKSRLVSISGRDQKIINMYCPDTDESFYLTISGSAEYYIGGQLQSTGMWSTGLYDADGFMSMLMLNSRRYFFGTGKNTRGLVISGRRCMFLDE